MKRTSRQLGWAFGKIIKAFQFLDVVVVGEGRAVKFQLPPFSQGMINTSPERSFGSLRHARVTLGTAGVDLRAGVLALLPTSSLCLAGQWIFKVSCTVVADAPESLKQNSEHSVDRESLYDHAQNQGDEHESNVVARAEKSRESFKERTLPSPRIKYSTLPSPRVICSTARHGRGSWSLRCFALRMLFKFAVRVR
jgi:hypothetical protein